MLARAVLEWCVESNGYSIPRGRRKKYPVASLMKLDINTTTFSFWSVGCKNLYLHCLCSGQRDTGLPRRTNKGSSRVILAFSVHKTCFLLLQCDWWPLIGFARRSHLIKNVCSQEAELKTQKQTWGRSPNGTWRSRGDFLILSSLLLPTRASSESAEWCFSPA